MFSKREPSVVQFLLTVVSVFLVSLTYSNLLSGPVGVGLSESAVPAAQSTLAFVVGLTSSLLYYRLYSRRHPLYGVPGPFAARCSQLWLFSPCGPRANSSRHAGGAQEVRRHRKLFATCNVLFESRSLPSRQVRIGPNEVSVATADTFLSVHGAKSWIKGASYLQTASGMSSLTETSLISLRGRKGFASITRIKLTRVL